MSKDLKHAKIAASLVKMFQVYRFKLRQDLFWKETAKQVKKDRKAERLKLIEAFNYLGV